MDKNVSIKWYQTLDSTNLQAAREAGTSDEGTVWIADFQTSGRGQRGNRWESKEGENLTFTILFLPEFLHPGKQFLLSQICSVGIIRYLSDKGLPAKIKWPNDIYVGDKKICGMLIENSISGDKLSVSIAGIGFNLNQTIFASDAPNPTSLLLECTSRQNGATCTKFSRRGELAGLLGYIFTAYDELKEGFEKELDAEYNRNLYRLGEFHKFIEICQDAPADIPVEKISGGTEITAKITGTDSSGCAILEHADGTIRHYPFKGIRYVISSSI